MNRLSPGNEQREYWGSQSADAPGSRNIIGIKNPAVDALIDAVIFAKDRDDLVAATKALDRVLLWNHYVVPQWDYPKVSAPRAGIVSAGRPICRNTARPDSRPCGGSTPTRPPGSANDLEEYFAHGAALPPACCSVLASALLGASWLRPAAADAGRRASRHVGVRRSEISGRFSAFRLRQSRRAQGRRVLVDPFRSRAYNQSFFTFNSLNAFILKGEGAQGMDMTFATLMARAGDEPDAMYGLVAKSVQISPDKTDLSLHAAAGSPLSRRLETDGA